MRKCARAVKQTLDFAAIAPEPGPCQFVVPAGVAKATHALRKGVPVRTARGSEFGPIVARSGGFRAKRYSENTQYLKKHYLQSKTTFVVDDLSKYLCDRAKTAISAVIGILPTGIGNWYYNNGIAY